MVDHDRFRFKTLDELKAKIDALELDLPCSEDIEILGTPVAFGNGTVPNRLACQPMEGCDGLANGAPSDLTRRRYRRFAEGGSGLLWFEACAITRESRANPRQLWIHEEVLDDYKHLVKMTREAAYESMEHNPYLVLQLTHSGRYSRPEKRPHPILAHHSKILDPRHNLPEDYPLIDDEELVRLQDVYVDAARLAQEAGFDAVDVKSCHRYLISELLASFTRENSLYGGPYENRVRMLLETVTKIREALPDLEVTSRLNAYDAIEHPYGWGVDKEDFRKSDLTEPLRLIGQLRELGYRGLNVTIANPYFNPHYGRPYDQPITGGHVPNEHPLEGVERLLHTARTVQQAYPNLTVVGTGYSWLRQFVPYVAAATIQQGWNSIAGLGRGAFAYPDFAKDILKHGEMDGLKTCITCSSCTQIMRDDGCTGCVPRDPDPYRAIYKEGIWKNPAAVQDLAAKCHECIEPTCSAHCPAGIDIPSFLKAVAEDDEPLAYRILRQSNLLPEICGFACPVEVQCQGHCIEQYVGDTSIPIARIQRYIAERAREHGWTALAIPPSTTGRHVAVVGAGPAGLSCTAVLIEKGHKVSILERASQAGGKALSVIPHDRLPEDNANAEILSIFDGVGNDRLAWQWNRALGQNCTLLSLQEEGFDAVALAFGLGNTTSLAMDEARPEGVLDALGFLSQMKQNEGHRVHGKVAIIGGGNTALDAAVVACERGADDVYVVYRRSFEEMPAWPSERQTAIDKGIHFLILTQPVGYEKDERGCLKALRVVRTELGAPDASGRRQPVALKDTEHAFEVTTVIEALGEKLPAEAVEKLSPVTLSARGLIEIDQATWMTSQPGVFAAGDLVNGGTTVVQAIAEGRDMAKSIDAYLT